MVEAGTRPAAIKLGGRLRTFGATDDDDEAAPAQRPDASSSVLRHPDTATRRTPIDPQDQISPGPAGTCLDPRAAPRICRGRPGRCAHRRLGGSGAPSHDLGGEGSATKRSSRPDLGSDASYRRGTPQAAANTVMIMPDRRRPPITAGRRREPRSGPHRCRWSPRRGRRTDSGHREPKGRRSVGGWGGVGSRTYVLVINYRRAASHPSAIPAWIASTGRVEPVDERHDEVPDLPRARNLPSMQLVGTPRVVSRWPMLGSATAFASDVGTIGHLLADRADHRGEGGVDRHAGRHHRAPPPRLFGVIVTLSLCRRSSWATPARTRRPTVARRRCHLSSVADRQVRPPKRGAHRGDARHTSCRAAARGHPGCVFLLFSSRLGCLGSLALSVLLTLLLLWIFRVI
jgi:hypothetical protein